MKSLFPSPPRTPHPSELWDTGCRITGQTQAASILLMTQVLLEHILLMKNLNIIDKSKVTFDHSHIARPLSLSHTACPGTQS